MGVRIALHLKELVKAASTIITLTKTPRNAFIRNTNVLVINMLIPQVRSVKHVTVNVRCAMEDPNSTAKVVIILLTLIREDAKHVNHLVRHVGAKPLAKPARIPYHCTDQNVLLHAQTITAPKMVNANANMMGARETRPGTRLYQKNLFNGLFTLLCSACVVSYRGVTNTIVDVDIMMRRSTMEMKTGVKVIRKS